MAHVSEIPYLAREKHFPRMGRTLGMRQLTNEISRRPKSIRAGVTDLIRPVYSKKR